MFLVYGVVCSSGTCKYHKSMSKFARVCIGFLVIIAERERDVLPRTKCILALAVRFQFDDMYSPTEQAPKQSASQSLLHANDRRRPVRHAPSVLSRQHRCCGIVLPYLSVPKLPVQLHRGYVTLLDVEVTLEGMSSEERDEG